MRLKQKKLLGDNQLKKRKVRKKKQKRKIERKRREKSKKGKENMSNILVQNLSYPHAPSKRDNARHYARFLDIFSWFQINIPFSEDLEEMPTYAKFMKGILTKKIRQTDQETITIDDSCSTIIRRTLPQKESDLGRVTLPVTIGNVISYEKVRKYGLKTTRMTLQFARKSITCPHGVTEDVLVKIDKFLFPVDFVVIDMEENDDA